MTLERFTTFSAPPNANKTTIYSAIARELSKIAGRKPAWTMRYVMTVITGSNKPSAGFAHAVSLLAADIDGTPPEFSEAEPIQVNANPAKIQPGALVLGQSKICDYPPCTVIFVPPVPWTKYCPAPETPKIESR